MTAIWQAGGPVLVALFAVSLWGWSRILQGLDARRRGWRPVRREAVLQQARAAAAALPLLGLLGTVLGMMQTFDALRSPDVAEQLLARGIAGALVTTQAGLVLAIPLWIAGRVLESRFRREAVGHV